MKYYLVALLVCLWMAAGCEDRSSSDDDNPPEFKEDDSESTAPKDTSAEVDTGEASLAPDFELSDTKCEATGPYSTGCSGYGQFIELELSHSFDTSVVYAEMWVAATNDDGVVQFEMEPMTEGHTWTDEDWFTNDSTDYTTWDAGKILRDLDDVKCSQFDAAGSGSAYITVGYNEAGEVCGCLVSQSGEIAEFDELACELWF